MNAVPADIFSSEDGVLKALVLIRNSPLPPEEKGQLRDLFLDYAGETSDDRKSELRQTITKQLAGYADKLPSLAPVEVVEKKEPAAQTFSIGRQRPTPVFGKPASEPKPEPVAETTPVEPEPVVPSKPEVKEALPPPAPAVPEVKEPEPVVNSAPAVDLKARITEIKHTINGKVGNPVNLITADEKIGREYMSALLDAMKSTSGGGNEQAAAERLEAAYKAATELIARMPQKEQPAPEPVEVKPEPVAETVPIEPEPVVTVPKPTPAPVPEMKEVPPPPPPKPTSSEGLYHQPIDETEDQKPEKRGLSFLWQKEEKTSLKDEAAKATPQSKATPSSEVKRLNVKGGTQAAPAVTEGTQLKSLRNASTLDKEMDKFKAEAEKREEELKKPIADLNAKEVQAGLEQLLSEWKLFHRSGFLGTGPAGINHPLYKQLSTMPMAAVIAGRFEGASPEIKQSLTDYMNGWRYEQGIIHEMGETFEHYLRRVIKQILDRQRLAPST